MVSSIIVIISSLFLIFQGVCWYGLIDINALCIEKFLSSTVLAIIRAVILKYAVIIGIAGVGLGVSLFLLYRKKDLKENIISNFIYIFIFPLMAIFTII